MFLYYLINIYIFFYFVTENSNGIIEPFNPWPDYVFTGKINIITLYENDHSPNFNLKKIYLAYL